MHCCRASVWFKIWLHWSQWWERLSYHWSPCIICQPCSSREGIYLFIWLSLLWKTILIMFLIPALSNNGEKAVVSMHVDILSILAISEVSETFAVKFQLSIEWKDQRLTFRNLKKDNLFNVVSMSEAQSIWSPVVVFENTPSMKQSKVGNYCASCRRLSTASACLWTWLSWLCFGSSTVSQTMLRQMRIGQYWLSSRVVEQSRSLSTQPRSATRCPSL